MKKFTINFRFIDILMTKLQECFEIISYLAIYRDEFIIFGMWNTNTLNTLRPSNALLIGELNIIGSDKDLSPGRRQAIMRTDDRILDTREETSEKC